MDLIKPFIGEYPNKVIKWTNTELEENKKFVQKSEGTKQCVRGRMYMLRAAGELAVETIVDIFSVPAFIVVGPIARFSAVFCTNSVKKENHLKKTEILSAKNVLLLAVRTCAVALATFTTFVVGVFISANAAIKIQEKLRILKRDNAVQKVVEKVKGEIKNAVDKIDHQFFT